jgi:NAD(P)H-dependent FMN reductase
MQINTTKELKDCLRSGSYAWPGGYPTYFVTSDGGALSHASVRSNLRSVLSSVKAGDNDGWRVVACEVNWEDAELYCDHSGERIESAYAEDAHDLARVGTSLPSDGAGD